jgi:Ca2+-binding EF-hand superfamily protein
MLSCSGFNHSCSDVVGSSLDCPINCERTNNRYYEPCRNMLRNYINDNYETIIYIIGGAGGLLLIGMMFNFITFCALVKAKAEIRQQHKKALASFRQNKAGKGVQDRHKALYILKSLGSNDTDALIKEFQRMDADGSGTLSKKEMFMFLKGTMCYRATADEINCIFELADVDNSGTISLHEFLAIFGRRAPVSKTTPMRRQDQAALVRQRMRNQFAGTDLYDARDDEYFGGPSMACSPSGGYDVQHSVSSPGMLHTPSGAHHGQGPVMGTVHLRPIESMPHYSPGYGGNGNRAYQQREQDIDDLL